MARIYYSGQSESGQSESGQSESIQSESGQSESGQSESIQSESIQSIPLYITRIKGEPIKRIKCYYCNGINHLTEHHLCMICGLNHDDKCHVCIYCGNDHTNVREPEYIKKCKRCCSPCIHDHPCQYCIALDHTTESHHCRKCGQTGHDIIDHCVKAFCEQCLIICGHTKIDHCLKCTQYTDKLHYFCEKCKKCNVVYHDPTIVCKHCDACTISTEKYPNENYGSTTFFLKIKNYTCIQCFTETGEIKNATTS